MSLFRPQFWKIPEISDAERRRLPELAAALERRLQDIAARYPQAVFASSLAVEDMVITDAVCRLKLLSASSRSIRANLIPKLPR